MHFGLSATLFPFLEASAALHNMATSSSRSRPNLLQVLGDTTFGLKAFMPDAPGQIVQFGGQAELMLLNGTGGVGLDGGGTSFALRAMTSFALDNFENPDESVPLRFHTNLGYVFDNSANLVDDIENTDPPNGRGESILRTERFGLDINRVDFFQIGLGGEFIHDYVRPFIEWNIDVPVNRADYTCDEDVAEDHGDQCLAKSQTFSAAPSRLTLGTRVYPWAEQGLAILAAVDIGTGATSLFLDEVAPEPPYNLWLGLAWAVDTVPPPPVIQRVVAPAPPPPPVQEKPRFVIGYVVDKETGGPVAGATRHARRSPHVRLHHRRGRNLQDVRARSRQLHVRDQVDDLPRRAVHGERGAAAATGNARTATARAAATERSACRSAPRRRDCGAVRARSSPEARQRARRARGRRIAGTRRRRAA